MFINCPFDPQYQQLFHAIIFAIYDCGFLPRSALEVNDSGANRLDKIVQLIKECRYGVHDLCRTELDIHTQLPRSNMPFELGLDLGSKHYGTGKLRNKSQLIFDSEPYRYKAFISDLGGQDLVAHHHDPAFAIRHIRNWLRPQALQGGTIPGPTHMIRHYETFQADLPIFCSELQLELSDLSNWRDLTYLIETWLANTARVE